jgi:hypothetical protein
MSGNLTHHEGADALGAAELVAGHRHGIGPERCKIDRNFPYRLHRVAMQQGAAPVRDLRCFAATGCSTPVSLLASINATSCGVVSRPPAGFPAPSRSIIRHLGINGHAMRAPGQASRMAGCSIGADERPVPGRTFA